MGREFFGDKGGKKMNVFGFHPDGSRNETEQDILRLIRERRAVVASL